MIPSLGYVYIWSDSPEHNALALLGDKTPSHHSGVQSYGGWERIKRKRRRSIVEWLGNEPLVMDVPIIIDAFAKMESVEGIISQIEAMAGREAPGATDKEPPLVHFESMGVVPHDYHREENTDWVIEDIEWGDADRDKYGNRVRQAMTIVFAEYIEDDDLAGLTSAQKKKLAMAKRSEKKGKGAKKARQPRYVVKGSNVTMESIAKTELGKSSRWHEIKKLNPKLHDPTKVIQPGTIVLLP